MSNFDPTLVLSSNLSSSCSSVLLAQIVNLAFACNLFVLDKDNTFGLLVQDTSFLSKYCSPLCSSTLAKYNAVVPPACGSETLFQNNTFATNLFSSTFGPYFHTLNATASVGSFSYIQALACASTCTSSLCVPSLYASFNTAYPNSQPANFTQFMSGLAQSSKFACSSCAQSMAANATAQVAVLAGYGLKASFFYDASPLTSYQCSTATTGCKSGVSRPEAMSTAAIAGVICMLIARIMLV